MLGRNLVKPTDEEYLLFEKTFEPYLEDASYGDVVVREYVILLDGSLQPSDCALWEKVCSYDMDAILAFGG